MIGNIGLYRSAGPLGYLLMTKKGEMVLGIFEYPEAKNLVLIFHYEYFHYVIKPSSAELRAIMQNKITIGSVMDPGNITDSEDNIPAPFMSDSTLFSNLKNLLNRHLNCFNEYVLQPNYYYTYNQHIFDMEDLNRK